MNLTSIDVGVRKALQAYKIEKGMSPAEAEAWATRNLTEAVNRVRAAMATGGTAASSHTAVMGKAAGRITASVRKPGSRSTAAPRVDDEIVLQKAFASLKTWAQSRR